MRGIPFPFLPPLLSVLQERNLIGHSGTSQWRAIKRTPGFRVLLSAFAGWSSEKSEGVGPGSIKFSSGVSFFLSFQAFVNDALLAERALGVTEAPLRVKSVFLGVLRIRMSKLANGGRREPAEHTQRLLAICLVFTDCV